MRFAFCVFTPFQLLNCVNFVWHDIEDSRGNGDLYIYADLLQAKYPDAIARLKEKGLFANIYPSTLQKRQKGWSRSIAYDAVRIAEYFMPRRAMRHYSDGGIDQRNYYDVIMASADLALVVALADINKRASVWMYDDGAGSYYGNFMKIASSKKSHLFYKVFKKGAESLSSRVTRLYVNNKSMCESTMSKEILQLPPLDHADDVFKDYLNELFNCPKTESSMDRKYIFLSDVFEKVLLPPPKDGTKIELRTILNYLNEHHNAETVVRKHPQEGDDDFGELKVAKWEPMWELFCQTSLRDDQYLIGIFSTAQLSPKMFFNKEPHLIFLYELVSCRANDDLWKNERDILVQNIRDSYTDKSKVQVPKTMQEFIECLQD